MGRTKEQFTEMMEQQEKTTDNTSLKPKQTLFNINQEYVQYIQILEEKDYVLDPEDEAFLAINKSQLEQKSISYLEVIQAKEAFAERIDIEIKRLQALKKRQEKTVDKLKESLLTAVKTFGVYEVGFTKFGTRKSESVIVDASKINQLPAEYKEIKVSETPNKDKIKKALKAGAVIDGCYIQENLNLKIN